MWKYLAMFAVLLGGTACLAPRVTVMPSGPGITASPKPPGCRVDFYRSRVDRSYDELAAIRARGGDSFKNDDPDFREVIRAKACELGADAVIVTQDLAEPGGTMVGTAIKFRDPAVPVSAAK